MPSRKAEIKEVKETVMSDPSNAVAIYESHTQAEAALQKLSGASFDIKKISIIGKGYHTEENVVGYYTTGDRMKHWGGLGAFWGGPLSHSRRRTRSGGWPISGGVGGRAGISGRRRRALRVDCCSRRYGH